jgi:hypothetical protein
MDQDYQNNFDKLAAFPNWNVGMLEYWNIGKMGFRILSCWVNGPPKAER